MSTFWLIVITGLIIAAAAWLTVAWQLATQPSMTPEEDEEWAEWERENDDHTRKG
jgi:hypothetical protein